MDPTKCDWIYSDGRCCDAAPISGSRYCDGHHGQVWRNPNNCAPWLRNAMAKHLGEDPMAIMDEPEEIAAVMPATQIAAE